jgi:hypothetical protein
MFGFWRRDQVSGGRRLGSPGFHGCGVRPRRIRWCFVYRHWSDGRIDPEKFGGMTMKALNAFDSPATPAGSTVTISTPDVIAQQFTDCEVGFPQFVWKIKWITSGRSGFLVQEVVSRIRIFHCQSGASIDNPLPFTPRYWEVWTVDSFGNMAPTSDDTWTRHGFANSKGEWSVQAC